MGYPPQLTKVIDLFAALPEEEKRENLIAYAEQAKKHGCRWLQGEPLGVGITERAFRCRTGLGSRK